LHYCAIDNRVKLINFLIESGIDINIKDHNGWNPLVCTVIHEVIEPFKILIQNGAERNIKIPTAKKLIQKGANKNLKIKMGNSIYDPNIKEVIK